jgi:hypothetical protein
MAKVLRPRVERFGVEPLFIGDLNERVPQRVWIEIRQPRSPAGLSEDAAHGVGVRPWLAINRDRTEQEIVAVCNLGQSADVSMPCRRC